MPEGQWSGQVGIDHAPGGPFAIFGTAIMGWRALARNLLVYYEIHGLVTLEEICERWAPPKDNNDTEAYTKVVCKVSGFWPTVTLDLRNELEMDKVCAAIAQAEGGSNPDGSALLLWDASERLAGVRLALKES